jgi:DNA modification methylase
MKFDILIGDCRARLKELPDESVHCVVTSPPYFGLRDYGTATWEGGNDITCNHRKVVDADFAVATSTLGGGKKTTGHLQEGFSSVCGRCGARRIDSQIGLEQTPDAYVAELVAVFREVRRVLRGDGTCWLNLGDSYAGSWGNYGGKNRGAGTQRIIRNGSQVPNKAYDDLAHWRPPTAGKLGPGIKPKDLIGIPWRVAFALQADGWWLRQDIIWSKPNPMPESVTDRCTKAHEYLFLLTKSARYFYDAEAIKEPAISGDPRKPYAPGQLDNRGDGHDRGGGKVRESVKRGGFNSKTNAMPGREAFRAIEDWRNKRSVWEVATQPFAEAHFATFPPDLIEPCIKAGCPDGGTVLDPFGGAGTTGLVADRLGRNAILIELNPEYANMAERRLRGDSPMFADVSLDYPLSQASEP